MKTVLIVANQTLLADELIAAAMRRKAEEPCEFRVLVPATPLSRTERALRESEHPGAVYGESGPVALARMRLGKGLTKLAEFGITATGDVGHPDPFTAIQTVCAHATVHEIIISTLPRRASRWIAADLPHRVRRRLAVMVTHIETGEVLHAAERAATSPAISGYEV